MANEFVAHGLMYSNGEHSPAHIPTRQKSYKNSLYIIQVFLLTYICYKLIITNK
jgi:hypothetical protein